jgi:2-polyprenyl-6-methoxyphenol hydroxylase-like FAD-dependent oxidoreductase
MNFIDTKKIAIVGGGPGGLTLARLLQQSGAQISVYERDPSRRARVQGSALDLHEESGLAALEAAGLMDAFWANHRPDHLTRERHGFTPTSGDGTISGSRTSAQPFRWSPARSLFAPRISIGSRSRTSR